MSEALDVGRGGVEYTSAEPAVRAIGDALLSFPRCFGLKAREAVYISTPITTGQHFAEWFRDQDDRESAAYRERHVAEIVERNLRTVQPLVERLRSKWGREAFIIDPTGLDDVPNWTQPDYHEFWVRLIELYCSRVVFAEGWQFSNGCSLEYAAATGSGAETLDHLLEPLRPRKARALMQNAITELRTLDVDTQLIERALSLLSSLEAASDE